MYSVNASPSLTRRLIGRYLMFGLAGILACLYLSLVFSFRGNLQHFVGLAAFPPIIVLAVGAIALWKTVRLSDAIESQLREASRLSTSIATNLRPLAESAPAAVGWNNVLQQLREQQTISQIEMRLAESSKSLEYERWQIACNLLQDGIAAVDCHGRVCLANNALAAIFGATSIDSIIGCSMIEQLKQAFPKFTPQIEQLPTHANVNVDLFDDKNISAGVWRLTRKSADQASSDGINHLWTVRDITHLKLAEEARNQFVLSASHELRTPLANIKAYAETLATTDDIPVEQQHEFYNVINSEASRLARFVDELLSVNQLQVGAVTIHRNEIDVERLIQEIVDKIQPLIRKKNQLFECKIPPKLPKLRLDKDKFVACLINLLGNAAKYTPDEGSIRFIVEIGDDYALFHVEDTGIGIASDELPRITEKFYRSSDERVQKIVGSGLGLAFCQEVARLHGGKITVKSDLNKGSRFTLSIPVN
jgi:signal transduction histidine kinase